MNPIESITVAPTSERQAEPGRFGAALRSAAAGLASGIAAGVELAAPLRPRRHGPVRRRPLRRGRRGAVRRASGAQAGSGRRAAPRRGRRSSPPPARCSRSRQPFNLQYLQLQENMQRESREFTALSNVMKVKHDSAKSAIDNIH